MTTHPHAPAALSQPVLTPLTRNAIFLVLTIDEGGEETVRQVLGEVAGLQRAIGFRYPRGGLEAVVGIGSDAWDRLFAGPRPAHLHPLPVFSGERHSSVSTPGDLLLHVRAEQMFLCFAFAAQVMDRLRGVVQVADEVHGFRYFDERDLLGFVDGTENPTGDDAVDHVIVSADQDEHFAGSSYVVVQKYLHDLRAWNAMTVEHQEAAIGRSKLDDIEFPDAQKAPNAHNVLTSITDENGNDRKIKRENMPFGRFSDDAFGTYFIGYADDPAVTEKMLSNMFIGDPVGTSDRILDFSTPATGCLFFVPTLDFFDDLPEKPDLPR